MYDQEAHVFFPNTNLSTSEQEKVADMIQTLGINWDPIRDQRRIELTKRLSRIVLGFPPPSIAEYPEFPTAYQMILQELNS